MLAHLRPRCLLHSSHCTQTRSLNTLPRKIPTYVKRWNPTLHRSTDAQKVPTEPTQFQATAINNVSRQKEREELRDAQRVIIVHKDSTLRQHHAYRRLNHLLHRADANDGRDATIRAPLWRAYSLAKKSDPRLPSHMPDRAWDLLWALQAVESPDNRNRKVHLEELNCDMRSVNKCDTAGQRAQYLEELFLSGKEEQALNEWEEDHDLSSEGERHDYKPEHLEVGAKLHALAGNADRARQIMDELFRLYSDWNRNPSVMMAVFRAHTSSGLAKHHDKAKEIYIQMKERMGNTVSLKDYDAWLVGFLEARHLWHAKQVFKDMVKSGHLAVVESAERADEVLKRLHLLYRLGTDISKMTSIALDAISVLPPAYHGYLFGDWMKSAVVQQAPEAAAQILDMMFQRGYNPEVFHFNMLLKALLRTKERPNILKAENIGWSMIDEARKVHDKSLSKAVGAKKIPVANVTTFAMIMHHHAQNLQWEHVDYLARQLKETAVQPNVTIMNVLMDNKTRQGKHSEAWMIYKRLTEPQDGAEGVYPNGATFRCLWKTLRLALSSHETRKDANLPTPRELLKEMVHWWTLCRSRYDASRFRQGLAGADNGAITSLILHCFSYTEDLPGSLVALHILRHKFDIFPTDKSAEILQKQMAWVDMARKSEFEREQFGRSGSYKRSLARIRRVYDILLQRRLDRMAVSEEEYMKLTQEEIGDMGLNMLSEFVRVMLKRKYLPEIVEMMIEATVREVGVAKLETGDMNAFEVA